jgi:hypothetical protein
MSDIYGLHPSAKGYQALNMKTALISKYMYANTVLAISQILCQILKHYVPLRITKTHRFNRNLHQVLWHKN